MKERCSGADDFEPTISSADDFERWQVRAQQEVSHRRATMCRAARWETACPSSPTTGVSIQGATDRHSLPRENR